MRQRQTVSGTPVETNIILVPSGTFTAQLPTQAKAIDMLCFCVYSSSTQTFKVDKELLIRE